MAKKPDRRTVRTQAALMSAFVELLLSEGYETTTVEEVAARANVGRSTFYLHFTGKEDILRKSLARPSGPLAIIVGHNVMPEMMAGVLRHYQEQRRINRILFAEPMRAMWVKVLADLIEPRLVRLVRHFRARPVLPVALIALQIAEAQIGLITHWLLGKPGEKADAVAEALIGSTRATVAVLLRCPPEPPLFIPGERLRFVHG